MWNQLLVDLQTEPTQTSAGVLLPTAFTDDYDAFITPKLRCGTVLAIGPGSEGEDGSSVPMLAVEVGQKVVVAPTGGLKVEPEGRDVDSSVFLFEAEQIWAVV
jgi:co-chaperonin GroES (HSP10)